MCFSAGDLIKQVLEDMNLRDKIFNLEDIKTKIDEVGPYQNVFLQECEYMNYLLKEIIRYNNTNLLSILTLK